MVRLDHLVRLLWIFSGSWRCHIEIKTYTRARQTWYGILSWSLTRVWMIKKEFVILHIEFKWRVCVHSGQNASKNNDLLKKCFEQKVVLNLIFYKKLSWQTSISPSAVELGGSKDNALERECTCTLGLNATKNIKNIKKCFKQELFRMKFPTKNSLNAILYSPQEWS